MTIKEIKNKYASKIDSIDLDLLISYAINKPRVFLLTHPETALEPERSNEIRKLLDKRLAGVPTAYLTGTKEFYGLAFHINKHTLIPRPETELICQHADKTVSEYSIKGKHTRIIDIGTGSGCIIIALAACLAKKTGIKFYASDISRSALAVAQNNAKLNKLKSKIQFRQGDLLSPFLYSLKRFSRENKLVLTANLPYLTSAQIKKSPSIKHEPRKALDGGRKGLELYSRLFQQLKTIPANYELFCEIDPSQTKYIIRSFHEYSRRNCRINIHKDLAGQERVIHFRVHQC